MNLVKRTGIVLLVLVFFFSAWMAYHLLEQPKTQEISSVSPTDSIVPSQDTVETKPNEQELSVAENEFLKDSTFLQHMSDGEAGIRPQQAV